MERIGYLIPMNGQKSFYGKAVLWKNRDRIFLQSYDTFVAAYDNEGFHRLWDGWSATTAKHVNAFRHNVCGLPTMNKGEWSRLPVGATFRDVFEIMEICDE